MKKYTLVLLLLFAVGFSLPAAVHAAGDFLTPTSPLYFLQNWMESLRLNLTFSKDGKLNYLFNLNTKRVNEIKSYGKDDPELAAKIEQKYESNYQRIGELISGVKDQKQAAETLQNKNIFEFETLAKAYSKASQESQEIIATAEDNSAKNVSAILEKVSPEKVESYSQRVEQIKKTQMIGKIPMVEKESGNPSGNPADNQPKSLNPINEGKDLNQINNANGTDQNSGGAQPAPMNTPASQN